VEKPEYKQGHKHLGLGTTHNTVFIIHVPKAFVSTHLALDRPELIANPSCKKPFFTANSYGNELILYS